MFRYYHQEKLTNMSVYIPESDEIDWEMFIQDENERELTREVYENIGKIDEYRENHPDIPEKIYKKAQSISKWGVKDKYLICEKPCIIDEIYASDNMTHVTFIACSLLFFYGKMILEYCFQKIDS
jgi:hypothetical protein